jgi:hypothetical protein
MNIHQARIMRRIIAEGSSQREASGKDEGPEEPHD